MTRVDILGVQIDRISMSEALGRMLDFIAKKDPHFVVTANAEMVMAAHKNIAFREIMNRAGLVLPDGAGVVWASRIYGQPVPERVAGYDIVQELLSVSAVKGFRVFFFGSAPGIAAAAVNQAIMRNPSLHCVGIRDGYFDKTNEAEILSEICEKKPDILLCALGSPKQEFWLAENLQKLKVPVTIGVGGTFDVMAGKIKRAPLWMQKSSLEWLFRLAQQPKRFIRMLALPHFVLCVCLSAWTRRT